jgi:hypothetical protein
MPTDLQFGPTAMHCQQRQSLPITDILSGKPLYILCRRMFRSYQRRCSARSAFEGWIFPEHPHVLSPNARERGDDIRQCRERGEAVAEDAAAAVELDDNIHRSPIVRRGVGDSNGDDRGGGVGTWACWR